MRILGIDHGDKKIGLAISDETGLIARPLKVLAHRSRAEDAKTIAEIVQAEGAGKIVVGLPVDDEAEEGPQARRVRRWVEGLREACPMPIEFWDESLSSADAASSRRESGAGRKRRRASHSADDALAAAVMLQSYLDARQNA